MVVLLSTFIGGCAKNITNLQSTNYLPPKAAECQFVFDTSGQNFNKFERLFLNSKLQKKKTGNLLIVTGTGDEYAEAIPHLQLLLRRSMKEHDYYVEPVMSYMGFLAILHLTQGQYAEAVPLLRRVISFYEKKARSYDRKNVNRIASNFKLVELYKLLGAVYALQNSFTQATTAYQSTLLISEDIIRQNKLEGRFEGFFRSMFITPGIYGLAWSAQGQGKLKQALEYIRKGTNLYKPLINIIDRLMLGNLGEQGNLGRKGIRFYAMNMFKRHLEIAALYVSEHPEIRDNIIAETFETGQILRNNTVGNAISQMAAKFAIGSNILATLLKKRDYIIKRLVQGDYSLQAELQTINAQISNNYPKFFELSIPKPVDLQQLQQLLGSKEALILYDAGARYHISLQNFGISSNEYGQYGPLLKGQCLVEPQSSFVWLVTKTNASFRRINLSQQQINLRIQSLRSNLDPAENARLDRPYPVDVAYKLYQHLLEPEMAKLKGIKTLFVVTDGALDSLPFSVLVTEPPPPNPNDYQQIAWLSRKIATVSLPTVSSLKALRELATKQSPAPNPFIGFGDPKFEGAPNDMRGVAGIKLVGDINSGVIPANRLGKILGRLPDTADELRANARTLGAGKNSIFLQKLANIPQVRRTRLRDYRVVQFATHALVAGEIKKFQLGHAEPAIALTPPLQPTKDNDGLLRASHIAADLKLNADWVVLSACNTAATDGSIGASGLSGLAKAFFYAGARALLVSHWYVVSDSAVVLTTQMFKEWQANPSIGRAEALRRAQMYVLDHPDKSYFTHPGAWAPFIVAGEGGIGR